MDQSKNNYNIAPDLKEKMLAWEKRKPEFRQLQVMEDVADMIQELVTLGDSSKEATEKLGALLADAREQLVKLNEKESPDAPDYATPIVEMLEKLEKTMASKDYKPTIKVDAPKIDVPTPIANVTVDAPHIDVSGIEKLLKTEVPKAFEKAISQIPEPEKADNSDILSKFDGMLEVLESIDHQVRKTPTPPTTVKVTNPDGSNVGGGAMASTNAQSSVSVTNTNTTVLASNPSRLGFTIYNEGTVAVYVKLGATASTSSYTLKIDVDGYYECPFAYTGVVDGITSTGTATIRVTELE